MPHANLFSLKFRDGDMAEMQKYLYFPISKAGKLLMQPAEKADGAGPFLAIKATSRTSKGTCATPGVGEKAN
jgi:hypothetical protein